MPAKKYIVELTIEERSRLNEIVHADRMAAHKRRHAQMLLKADQGEHGPAWIDARIAEAFDCWTERWSTAIAAAIAPGDWPRSWRFTTRRNTAAG